MLEAIQIVQGPELVGWERSMFTDTTFYVAPFEIDTGKFKHDLFAYLYIYNDDDTRMVYGCCNKSGNMAFSSYEKERVELWAIGLAYQYVANKLEFPTY